MAKTGIWGANVSPDVVMDNTWHLLTMVNYNDNGTYRLRAYSDDGSTFTETGSGPLRDTGDLYIGTRSMNRWANFRGLMDDLRIYNRALSQSEVADLFNEAQ